MSLRRNAISLCPTGEDPPCLPRLPLHPPLILRCAKIGWIGGKNSILEPDLAIVDAHHHLWDRPGWRYLLDDLLADTNTGHNVIATVFVQARAMVRAAGPRRDAPPWAKRNSSIGVAAMSASGSYGKTRACAGIVGHADLTLGSHVEPVLLAHIRAGGDRFRGIRHITAWDRDASMANPAYNPPPGLLGDKRFRQGFAALDRLGLSFDAWLYHPQIGELAELARAFPETRIVLNHVGGPIGIGAYAGKHTEVFSGWLAAIKALAACGNVYVKLGGLGMRMGGFGFHERHEPPSSEMLARRVAPLCRRLYRGLWRFRVACLRVTFRSTRFLQLPGVLERLQAFSAGLVTPKEPSSSRGLPRGSIASTSPEAR